jgi:hypothetical protein
MVTQKLDIGDVVEVIEDQFGVPARSRGIFEYSYRTRKPPPYVEILVRFGERSARKWGWATEELDYRLIVTEDNLRPAALLPQYVADAPNLPLALKIRDDDPEFMELQRKHRERAKKEHQAELDAAHREEMEEIRAKLERPYLHLQPNNPGDLPGLARSQWLRQQRWAHQEMHKEPGPPHENER